MKTNNNKLSGKVAIVTGASKGIGASIARHLAAEGASVVVNYASSKAGADQVVAEITGDGGKSIAVQADLAKKADISRLFAETRKAFGSLGILVNAINPGMVETEGLHATGIAGVLLDQLVAQTPLGRIGQPRDIATAAVFLASSDSEWITGENFVISGGYR